MSTSRATRTRSISAKKRRQEASSKSTGMSTLEECGGGWCWKDEAEPSNGCRQFSAIVRNSKVVRIGDTVLIYGLSKQKYFIAKILGFTENLTDQQACASIEWLYWPSELSTILKKLPKHQSLELPPCLKNEAIFTNSKDSVEISSIADKTEVAVIACASTTPTVKSSTAPYVARWLFDCKTRKLTPLVKSKETVRTSPLKDGLNTTKSATLQTSKVKVDSRMVQQYPLSNSENQESPILKSLLSSQQKTHPPVPASPKVHTPTARHTPSRHAPLRSENKTTTSSYPSPSSQKNESTTHYFDILNKKTPHKQSPLSTSATPKQKHVYSLTSGLTPKSVSLHTSSKKTPLSTNKQTTKLSPFTPKSNKKSLPLSEKKHTSTQPNHSKMVTTPRPSLGGRTPELKDKPFSPSSSVKSTPDVVGCRRQLKLDTSDVLESLSFLDEDDECSDMEVECAMSGPEPEPESDKSVASEALSKDHNSSKKAGSRKSTGRSRVDTPGEKASKIASKENRTTSEVATEDDKTAPTCRTLRSARKSQHLEVDEDPLTANIGSKSRSVLARPLALTTHRSKSINPDVLAEVLLSESDMETEEQVETEIPKTNQTNKPKMTRSQTKMDTSNDVQKTINDSELTTPDTPLPHITSAHRNTRSQSTRRTATRDENLKMDDSIATTTTPRTTRSKVEHSTKKSRVNISPSPDLKKTKPSTKTPSATTGSKSSTTTKAKRKRKRIVHQVKRPKVTNSTVASSNNSDNDDNDTPYLTESDQESDDNISLEEFRDDSTDSDEDFIDVKALKLKTPRTSSRKRPSPNVTPVSTKKRRISASASTTKKQKMAKSILKKATAIKKRKCLTPCMPQRRFCKKQGGDHFDIAKQRLHVSAVPESLPCRENEFASILSFVEGKLRSKTGGCMYISGVPGTGKTATVMEVTGYLKQAAEDKELPDFKFVDINGMRLTDPQQVYVSILKQLTGEKATPTHAATLLDKYFSSSKNKTPTLLLADELDLLWTRKQTVLYNLFEWPSRLQAKLIVLAVANTMDLPERIMMNKVSSRLGLTRLTFHPYTFQQLQEIVTSRMTGLRVFEPDAIQLAARKVAAVSGDARRALDISRRATEIAQSERNQGGGGGKKMTKESGLVGMHHVDRAVQEMFSSAKIQAIKHVSLHEKMFLKAILSEFRRTGLEEATFKHVCQQLLVLYRAEGILSANMTQLSCICSRLGARRLLLVEGGRMDIHRRIRLNISQDDVIFALRDV